MTMTGLRIALVSLVATCLVGCEKTQQVFTINPDGSGKVLHTATFPLDLQGMPSIGNQKQPKTDEEKVAAAEEKIIGKSEGVEAWKDVVCTATDDGLIKFSGMAYFPDISALKVSSLGGSSSSGTTKLEFEKTPGGYRVVARLGKEKKEQPEEAQTEPKTEADLRKELLRARTSWQYMRHMLGLAMANEVRAYDFVTPVAATKAENFERTPNGYSLVFDGGKVFNALDSLMKMPDDKLIAILGEGVDLKNSEKAMEYTMSTMGMDPSKEMALIVTLDHPQFDYAAEVAGARKEFAELCKAEGYSTTGSTAAAAPQVTGTGALKSAGVRSIQRYFKLSERDSERLSFEVRADFDGIATAISKVELDKLVGDGNRELIEKPMKLQGRLDDNGTCARFTVTVPLEDEVKSITSASGTLDYAVSSEPEEVDLGIMNITKGATGGVMNAEVRSVSGGWLKLAFTADETKVKDVLVYRPDGTVYEASGHTGQEWRGKYQKTFRPAPDDGSEWPERLGFKVLIYTKTAMYSAPWSVENISLPSTE